MLQNYREKFVMHTEYFRCANKKTASAEAVPP